MLMNYLKVIVLLFFSASSGLAIAQDTISVDYVATHTHTFRLVDGQLEGAGAAFLKSAFEQSQFVLLGESHGDARISEFTEAILPELSKVGYRYFCLEVGPHSAEVLKALSVGKDVRASLFEFYTNYFQLVKDIPIPFFDGIEDAAFLQQAIDLKFELFGIDQEYYSATLLLLDILLALDDTPATRAAHQTATAFVIQEQLKDVTEDEYTMHKSFLSSQELSHFFNTLDTANAQITQIIDDLRLSWRIYDLYDYDTHQNLELRAAYMKRLFVENYRRFAQQEALPKILIKMGGAHTIRGITYNSVYDIGNLVHELATFNQTNDLNIGFLFRFIEDAEEPAGYFDNADGNSNWIRQRRPLLLQGQKENWVVIDLRAMKKDMVNRKVWFHRAIRSMIYDQDLIVIPPMDREVQLNYRE